MKRHFGWAALFTSLGLQACSPAAPASVGSSDGGAEAIQGSPAENEKACADMAKARCSRNDTCSNATYNNWHYGDEPTCEKRVSAQCLANLNATGYSQTASTISACAKALPAQSCGSFFGDDPVHECQATAGTVPIGGPCAISSQCQSTYCAIPQYASCGACAPVPQIGDKCTATQECGLRGGIVCSNGVCAGYVGLNGICSKTAPCGAGLSCAPQAGKAHTHCQPAQTAVGAPCNAKRATEPGCDGNLGLYCSLDGTCQKETFAQDGEPCGTVNGTKVLCAGGGACDYDAPTKTTSPGDAGVAAPKVATCKMPTADGNPCDTKYGPPCLSPARCVLPGSGGTAGTCVVPGPTTCD